MHFKPADFCYSTTALENNIVNFVHKKDDLELWLNMQYSLLFINDYSQYITKITSGYRNEKVNKLVKGVKGSYHTKALAGDFRVNELFTSIDFAKLLRRNRDPRVRKVIAYENSKHLHVSLWPDKASSILGAKYIIKKKSGLYVPVK